MTGQNWLWLLTNSTQRPLFNIDEPLKIAIYVDIYLVIRFLGRSRHQLVKGPGGWKKAGETRGQGDKGKEP
ncbi:MAG: hypothetical protein KME32_24720 [Mojavia pulchra JT2-VF2]|uniref:Uncharacterized protein n=1 Tax=Mojavia pulchra JT2-VF2 TaxID=287848 RepID=A0A951Q508_9NOST|nr:hypothetical protein [Mojavia pulchra JT2-VF2]